MGTYARIINQLKFKKMEEKNYSISLELSKFKSVITKMKSKSGEMVEGIFIPFEPNHLKKTDKNQVFFNSIAWANKEVKYDNTHSLKQSLTKDEREKMSDDEQKNQPFFGNMKPFEKKETTNAVVDENPTFEENDGNELPF